MEANKFSSWTLSRGAACPKRSQYANPSWALSRGGACLKLALQSNTFANLSSDVSNNEKGHVHYKDPVPSTSQTPFNEQVSATTPACSLEDSDISEVEDPEWVPPVKKKCLPPLQSSDSELSDSSDNATELNKNKRVHACADMRESEKSNQRKLNFLARMQGHKYMGLKKTDGKYTYSVTKEPKRLGPRECQHSCTKNKSTKCIEFTEQDRQNVFDAFWKMDWNQKRVFVANNVDSHIPSERTTGGNSRRNRTLVYHLKRNESRIRVCKNMLLSTIGIGEWQLLKWTNDSQNGTQTTSVLSKTPARKHANHMENREAVRYFVESLPKLPSHYCRSSTSRLYLQSDIKSFSHLYGIYKEYCTTAEIKSVSIKVFKSVLNEMKVSIFHPKKDQCDVCCSFETGNLQEEVYRNHIQKKNEARNDKETDKVNALEGRCRVVTVDLQAVLLAPSLLASSMYYKTKLACHNYTIYDLGSGEVSCYVWHEGEGDLGSSNFTSCISDYIEKTTVDGDKVLIIYSDGCTYQNRNCTLSNALLDLSVKKNLTIFQKILEKGHTQMECDSVHSTIEHALRHRSIYVPADYVNVMKNVRVSKPYKVNYLDNTFFKDFSQLNYYTSIRPGIKPGDLCVTDLRVLKYNPDGTIQYKTRYTEDYMDFPRKARCSGNLTHRITPLYNGPQKIKASKFKHLTALKKVIPPDYHGFYDGLLHE
ncbi:hypothetical protein SNE40_023402 [Patella caerulea]|uniref:Uncharacterized protein n=1 Tax=Patella caerulea TaxID=87958 RepID=A0AAN8G6C8_PATCE